MEHVLVTDLVKEVRVTLDENRKESSYVTNTTDNMELNEMIRSKLVEATRSILEVCPLNMLELQEITIAAASHTENSDGSGHVVLPDNFLRLGLFKLSSWGRGVTNVAEEGSAEERRQHNPLTMGSPLKPVCVWGRNALGKLTIEYYSAGRDGDAYNHDVEKALFVPLPSLTADDKLDVPGVLRFSIIHFCAGLVEVARGNAALADVFFKIANNFKS